MNKCVRNGIEQSTIGFYGCHNRLPYQNTVRVPNGFINGLMTYKEIPYVFSKVCNYDKRLTDERCKLCRWVNE